MLVGAARGSLLPGVAETVTANAEGTQSTSSIFDLLYIFILAGFVGKAIPPRAGGRPYVKER